MPPSFPAPRTATFLFNSFVAMKSRLSLIAAPAAFQSSSSGFVFGLPRGWSIWFAKLIQSTENKTDDAWRCGVFFLQTDRPHANSFILTGGGSEARIGGLNRTTFFPERPTWGDIFPAIWKVIRIMKPLCFLGICLFAASLFSQTNEVPAARQSREAGASANASHPDAKAQAAVLEGYGRLPLSFERNQGQVDRRVKFFSRGAGYALFLTSEGATLSLTGHAALNGHAGKVGASEGDD